MGLENIFYAFEAIVASVMVTNIFTYAYLKEGRKPKARRDRKALAALALAIPLNLMYPYAVIIVYSGGVGLPESKMWTHGSWIPNTGYAVFLWICRYVGFMLLGWGVLRVTGLGARIRRKWSALRQGRGLKVGGSGGAGGS